MLQLESNPRAIAMRNVSIQEFEEHPAELLAEVESGQRLTVIRGGKAVAEFHPVVDSDASAKKIRRAEAGARLLALMEKGIDLGGLRIESRDELYEREPYIHG